MTWPCVKHLRRLAPLTVHESSMTAKQDALAVLALLKCPIKRKLRLPSTAWKEKTSWVGPFVATKANPENAADCAQQNFSFKPGPLVQAFFCVQSSTSTPVHNKPYTPRNPSKSPTSTTPLLLMSK